MRNYVACGSTPVMQARDLAMEAASCGEYVVAEIEGITVGAWPGDSPTAVYEAYIEMQRLAQK